MNPTINRVQEETVKDEVGRVDSAEFDWYRNPTKALEKSNNRAFETSTAMTSDLAGAGAIGIFGGQF
jgi:hypothetical protein